MTQPTCIDDLPEPIDHPAAWIGLDMASNTDQWLITLSTEQIVEIEAAAVHFLSLNRDLGEIDASDFPLPSFKAHLETLRNKLVRGNGVEVIRGLQAEKYERKFVATIFCGLGAHLGIARSQNAEGHILGHVRDTGADANATDTRIYQTAERQTFHTDSADVVGLLCLKNAKEGGESLLVSALSIYNRMYDERPDLLLLLFDPIATDRRGEIPPGAKPFVEIPVLSWHAGFLTVFYQRQYIDSAQRFEGSLQLTQKHIEALDMFDALANDSQMHFGMQLQPGDMQFIYNHNQLHDRTGFTDWPEPENRRHLMRLWLSIEGDRPLPDSFAERYGSIEIGNRGGIVTESTRLHAPINI